MFLSNDCGPCYLAGCSTRPVDEQTRYGQWYGLSCGPESTCNHIEPRGSRSPALKINGRSRRLTSAQIFARQKRRPRTRQLRHIREPYVLPVRLPISQSGNLLTSASRGPEQSFITARILLTLHNRCLNSSGFGCANPLAVKEMSSRCQTVSKTRRTKSL